MDTLELRPTTPQDLPRLIGIERISYPSPWDVRTFLSVIGDEDCRNLTALWGGTIAGFCFAQLMRNMLHLLNIAVDPDFRRRGIARAMLEEMISFARSNNKSYVFLEVRRTNSNAQALYASLGFHHVCTWRRYYTDSGEDACIMARMIEGRNP
jgi:[ribosomal protein S18]-alanine N-acetyltransferase